MINFSHFQNRTPITQEYPSFSSFVNNDLSHSFLRCKVLNNGNFDLKKNEVIVNYEKNPQSKFFFYNKYM